MGHLENDAFIVLGSTLYLGGFIVQFVILLFKCRETWYRFSHWLR